MKVVVLDGYTVNPGDLSWEKLEELGDVELYDRTGGDQVLERAKEADLIITNKVPLPASAIKQLPRLKYIGVSATGYNIVDTQAAIEAGIIVTNVPDYGSTSVAQFVFALLLELCHHVGLHSAAVRAGEWSQSKDWCFWRTPLTELSGKTIGVIGLGRIGKQVATLAEAFGMKVIYATKPTPAGTENEKFTRVRLEDLLIRSDVVTLHCPLLPDTAAMINRDRLMLMKPESFLINTSRGPLVIEDDLADALNAGRLAGAGLDVLSLEPPAAQNPLLTAKNCIITPHIAWATKEARSRLLGTVVMNVDAFLRGDPQNMIIL
jgi:glycerate dehydrogenase